MPSPVLAGEKSFEEIIINGQDWYDDNGIDLVAGDPVASIDRQARRIVTRSGRIAAYDKLLIATGSDPFIIPVPGRDLPGVVTFRDLDDVDKMLAAAVLGGNAVVIGGGLLGLEAAHGLSLRGMKVTVISSDGNVIDHSLPGGGETNKYCGTPETKPADHSENSHSLGVLINFGKLKILDLGDLTYDKELLNENKVAEAWQVLLSLN